MDIQTATQDVHLFLVHAYLRQLKRRNLHIDTIYDTFRAIYENKTDEFYFVNQHAFGIEPEEFENPNRFELWGCPIPSLHDVTCLVVSLRLCCAGTSNPAPKDGIW